MTTSNDIAAHVVDHGAEGDHWATMRPVDEYLREQVENMAAALRLASGDATPADRERLGVDADPVDFCDDLARQWIDTEFLSIDWARWVLKDGHDGNGALARVELCTGTGGPHTEIVAQFSRNGACERVEAHQFGIGHREAWSTDYRALSTLADFCSNLLALDAE